MMDYAYYPEKKKKKNGQRRRSYWIPLLGLALLFMFAAVGLYTLNQFSVRAPEQQVFEVYADVLDANNQPVIFNRLSINTRLPDGAGGGFESKGNIYENYIHGFSYHEVGPFDEGCIFGEVEIPGYDPYKFSYFVTNMSWGVRVDIHVIADDSLTSTALAQAQDIQMPFFMAKPRIAGQCPV